MSSQVFAAGIPVIDAKAIAQQVERCAARGSKESPECIKAFKIAEDINNAHPNDNAEAAE